MRSDTQEKSNEYKDFPVDHYSYSLFTKFSNDPLMFKIYYINGERIETLSSPSNMIGRSAHEGLKTYFEDIKNNRNEGEAIKNGLEKGRLYLDSCSDGFIKYNTIAKDRATLNEKYAWAYLGYIQDIGFKKSIKEILLIEKMLQYKIEINGKLLPIPIKGSADLVYRNQDGKIIIRDHKFTGLYSNPDKIDGAKLIQAAFNYFLVFAELGEAPYSIIFEEYKLTKNKDPKVRQTKEYEIVFEKHKLVFDLFYRFYDDITKALLGKQVFIPNLNAIYDQEISILSYIHRLDVDEVRDSECKKLKVDNITEVLKQKIQKAGAMRHYLDTISKTFISGETLNYKNMNTEEKIKMKLAEHGLGVEFHSKVVGSNVTLYRYEPSIGLKMSRIESFVKDIEQVVETSGIRILAPIPNSGLIGFEVPNKERTFPTKRIAFDFFNLAMGESVIGDIVRMDIREAPHMLVCGATGSGKSVFVSSLIKQLGKFDSHVKMVLLDPKSVELAQFSKLKNVDSYISDPSSINKKLHGLIKEMNTRYSLLQSKGLRNIAEIDGDIPYIFVFIDEFGDLIASNIMEKRMVETGNLYKNGQAIKKNIDVNISDEIRQSILILAQKARAAGIHLIISTQRPSVKIVSGDIKANFPTRVAFRTSSAIDSHIILNQAGAEKLLGKGDMLLLDPSKGLLRLQGFNI